MAVDGAWRAGTVKGTSPRVMWPSTANTCQRSRHAPGAQETPSARAASMTGSAVSSTASEACAFSGPCSTNRLRAWSMRLLKRTQTRAGPASSTAPAAGSEATTNACATAWRRDGKSASRADAGKRRRRRTVNGGSCGAARRRGRARRRRGAPSARERCAERAREATGPECGPSLLSTRRTGRSRRVREPRKGRPPGQSGERAFAERSASHFRSRSRLDPDTGQGHARP